MALRFEPSRFFLKGERKNLLGSKRKVINIYFAFILQVLKINDVKFRPTQNQRKILFLNNHDLDFTSGSCTKSKRFYIRHILLSLIIATLGKH